MADGRMDLKTDWERKAIDATRPALAEALEGIGRLEPFNDCSIEQIDAVIKAVVGTYQKAMERLPWDEQVPF